MPRPIQKVNLQDTLVEYPEIIGPNGGVTAVAHIKYAIDLPLGSGRSYMSANSGPTTALGAAAAMPHRRRNSSSVAYVGLTAQQSVNTMYARYVPTSTMRRPRCSLRGPKMRGPIANPSMYIELSRTSCRGAVTEKSLAMSLAAPEGSDEPRALLTMMAMPAATTRAFLAYNEESDMDNKECFMVFFAHRREIDRILVVWEVDRLIGVSPETRPLRRRHFNSHSQRSTRNWTIAGSEGILGVSI